MCQMVACYVGLETARQNIVLSLRLDVHGQNSPNTGLFFYANLIRLECLQYGLWNTRERKYWANFVLFLVPQIPAARSRGYLPLTHILFCSQWSQCEVSESS
jgi:hypothetical protein